MTLLVSYVAVVVTGVAVVVVVTVRRQARLSAPVVYVSGRDADDYPMLVIDPADTGCRVTTVTVASGAPLTLRSVRYTLDLGAGPIVRQGTHAQVKAALRDAGVDDATFGITGFSPGAAFPAGREQTVFVLATPVVRRLAQLDAEMVFADPLGRVVTKTVPALPRVQQQGRAVAATERRPDAR